MKKVFFLLAFVIPALTYAEYSASSFKKRHVTYMAEAGASVKKGDILFKLDDAEQKILVERKKLQLQDASADFEDKKSDLKRSEILMAIKAISVADHDNTVVEYYKSQVLCETLKNEIKKLENDLDGMVVTAPYDCKVLRQVVCINSGTDYGTYVLEIQPLDSKNKTAADDSKAPPAMELDAAYSGETITYLPEEGQIVKKGDILLQYDTENIELDLKTLEFSLKEAEEYLKDAKRDLDRATKLVKDKVISKKAYEDVSYLYTKYSIAADILALDIKDTKREIKDYYTVRAPYDLKVVKHVLSVGSGTDDGKPILLVQKL